MDNDIQGGLNDVCNIKKIFSCDDYQKSLDMFTRIYEINHQYLDRDNLFTFFIDCNTICDIISCPLMIHVAYYAYYNINITGYLDKNNSSTTTITKLFNIIRLCLDGNLVRLRKHHSFSRHLYHFYPHLISETVYSNKCMKNKYNFNFKNMDCIAFCLYNIQNLKFLIKYKCFHPNNSENQDEFYNWFYAYAEYYQMRYVLSRCIKNCKLFLRSTLNASWLCYIDKVSCVDRFLKSHPRFNVSYEAMRDDRRCYFKEITINPRLQYWYINRRYCMMIKHLLVYNQ